MRRILLVLAVGAIMVLSSVSYAFAEANPDSSGDAGTAPGQANASQNCSDNVLKQFGQGQTPGGGDKEHFVGPTNCDHFWQESWGLELANQKQHYREGRGLQPRLFLMLFEGPTFV